MERPASSASAGDGSRPAVPNEDAAWVARVRDGDGAAFEAMFRRYAPELADYVYRHVQDQSEAEDVIQALFTNLWLGRERWTLRGSLAAYLYLAARNIMANRRRHGRVVDGWRARVVRIAKLDGARTYPAPDDEYHAAEMAAAIDAVIREFPTQRRLVSRLRWVDGLGYGDIARKLGIAEKTVERHLGIAFKELCAQVPGVRAAR
jgi:RNA polymerase sigma-70 factor (ECF subfamily)